ncbi:MAG: DegT/DnrJ/EryC1/StrS family aminotransferase [Polyangiaceae bacterium]
MSEVRLFDLRPEHEASKPALLAAFSRVLDGNSYILGPEVANFESHAARYLKVGHAVGVSNGSDALYLALLALGIGPGCEVITSPLTFVATAEAILRCGATPVFADIELDSFGLCPASTARMRTARTRVVLAVHLYGHPGKVLELAEYCAKEGILLVEDACQSFGARARDRAVGTLGSAGVYSFFPTKPLGGFGDGGLVVTEDERVARDIRAFRSHGVGASGQYERLGGNFRLDALQAALLDVKLAHVDESRRKRRVLAERYYDALTNHPALVPPVGPDASSESAWSLYTLRVPRGRDALRAHLSALGLESRIYYSALLSEQPLFAKVSRSDALPNASRAANEVLSIPIYAGMTFEAQSRVIDALNAFRPES